MSRRKMCLAIDFTKPLFNELMKTGPDSLKTEDHAFYDS